MTREKMEFPNTFDEFVESYGFKDNEEVYTNGSELIPVFRVKQWLDHIEPCEDAVSRQAALKAFEELPHEYKTKEQRARTGGIAACQVIIDDLPPVNPYPSRWNKLFTWLNDMRFGIAPDETTPEKDRAERWAQVELLDDIMAWMEPDEWPFSDPYEEGESE